MGEWVKSRRATMVKLDAPTEDSPVGTFEAIVNAFGVVDSDADRVFSEAFEPLVGGVSNSTPHPVAWSHQLAGFRAAGPGSVIGAATEAKVLKAGAAELPVEIRQSGALWIAGEWLAHDEAQTARDLAAKNLVREWSVAFRARPNPVYWTDLGRETDPDGPNPWNEVGGVDWHEIDDWVETSLVVRGANPGTATLSAKTLQDGEAETALLADLDARLKTGTLSDQGRARIIQFAAQLGRPHATDESKTAEAEIDQRRELQLLALAAAS